MPTPTDPVPAVPARRLRDLLALVDRAERGSLLAGEATILRGALTSLVRVKRSAGGLQAAVQRDRAVIVRVRELHKPVEHRGLTICAECSAWDGDSSTDNSPIKHPCPTIDALDGRQQPAGGAR